jgi:hypothetical protein
MTCDFYRPLLSRYVDGEASPLERAQVDAHIGGCAHCSALLSQYQMLRARLTGMPRYQPDARLRRRLFAQLDAVDAERADEVAITRRRAPAGAARRAAQPGWGGRLFGNLATGLAMLVVIAAGVLIWQMNERRGDSLVASSTPVLAVPTSVAALGAGRLPGALPTTTADRLQANGGGGRLASPTATFWSPSESGEAMHTVRDEAFGYQAQYPSGWWTASAIPAAGLLAHRVLRPWTQQDGQTPDSSVSIDVLDNAGGLAPRDALAHWGEAVAQVTPIGTRLAGLDGYSFVSVAAGAQRRATYLFAGALVYRIVAQRAAPSSGADPAETPVRTVSDDLTDLVAQSFQPAADAATHGGYAPTLFLRNGDLWRVDPQSPTAQPVTQGGRVRGFALSPDLSRVALLLAGTAAARWGQTLEVRPLDGGAALGVWHTGEIHAVAWYGDRELVALGGAAEANTPIGVYRMTAAADATPNLLMDLSRLPDGGAGATALRVAPDRLWLTFLATGPSGPDLYGVRPDGAAARSLLPNTAAHAAVGAYAWLPPADAGSAPRLAVATADALDELILPGPGETESRLEPMAQAPGITDLAVGPAGQIAALLSPADGPASVLVRAPNGASQMAALPAGAAVAGSLGWRSSGQAVLCREKTAKGEGLLSIAAPGGAVQMLTEALPGSQQ